MSVGEHRGRGQADDRRSPGPAERVWRRAVDISGFSFSEGATVAVAVAEVVSAAVEVASTLAEGSVYQLLLTLIYPVIITNSVRP